MQRLIDPNVLIAPLKEEYKKVKQAFDETSVFQTPNDVALYGALMQELGAVIGMIEDAPTIDAVPLDGSFLKMSKGDYLIYNRHWLYEHFDTEMEIERSVMKSIGYEPALKDAEPQWIPCGDAEPEHSHMVLISVYNAKTDMRFVDTGALFSDGWYGSGWKLPDYCLVTAWRELPEPYEVN